MKTVTILTLDTPNKNFRTYTTDTVKKIIDDQNGLPVFGHYGTVFSEGLDPEKLSHRVHNLRIENNQLIGDVEIMNNENGNKVQKYFDTLDFRLSGSGVLDDNFVVSKYILRSIDAIEDGA